MKRFLHLLLGLLATVIASATGAQPGPPAGAVWIDVRSPAEFAGGHLEGAHNIPHEEIVEGIAGLQLDYDTPVYLYCRSGRRADAARSALRQAGYTDVVNVRTLDAARALAAIPAGSDN